MNILNVCTLGAEMFEGSDFWLETRVIIKSLTHSWYPRTFGWFSWKWSKTKFKMVDSKSATFVLKNAQPFPQIWWFHCLLYRIPVAHIFAIRAQINQSVTQGPIQEIFTKNIENWQFWKTQFFWVGHFDFDFDFFASSPWKLVTNYVLEWMGLNFYDYDGLQPKITPPKHFSRQCTKHYCNIQHLIKRLQIGPFLKCSKAIDSHLLVPILCS